MRRPDEQDVLVVGATGDLAARKLLPALYNLSVQGLLPEAGDVVGAAPVAWDDDRFRQHARDAVGRFSRTPLDEPAWQRFAQRLRFVALGPGARLEPLQAALRRPRRLAYLAVPASAFESLIGGLATAGLAEGTSVIIEKPFGHDVTSARALNQALHRAFPEDRIFRIDHYMGKETVQNLLVFRFGNSVFERIWNRDSIEHVEISVAESLGVEHRGAFYEETGALRDIVQNHMFQVLAIVGMEPPLSFDPEPLRDEKVKLLNAVLPLNPHEVVRGQYEAGTVEGEPVVGYTDESGVAKGSTTETFVALRLHVDNWRWQGVPFLLRTGKRLAFRDTRVTIVFRQVPRRLFEGIAVRALDHNRLTIRIQPQEGIAMTFVAKRPGPDVETQTVRMDFGYGQSFTVSPPEAYERLLHDALIGDHTLFIREDEVERGWEIVQPVLDAPPPVTHYPAGSHGPIEAEHLIAPYRWHSVETDR